jgi:murein DD-endopeptidase MepM/ murein hydrolase activator NlpD
MKIHLRYKKTNKILLTLTTAILLTSFLQSSPSVHSLTEYEYEQKKDNISSKLSNIEDTIESTKSDLYYNRQRKATLEEEIASIDSKISQSERLIADTQTIIEQLDSQIAANEAEIDDLTNKIPGLIKETQKSQVVGSKIGQFFSCANIGECIGKGMALGSINDELKDVLDEIRDLNEKVKQDKLAQETSLRQQEELVALAEVQRQEKEVVLTQVNEEGKAYQEILAENESQKQEFYAAQEELEAKMEQARLEAQAQARNSSPNNSVGNTSPNLPIGGGDVPGGGGGQGCWFTAGAPLPVGRGFFMRPLGGPITGTYGCPPSLYIPGLNHDGIDISAPRGSSVKAAASGTVTQTSSGCSEGYYSCNGGFGNYVLIQHNAGGVTVYTLYAHLNSGIAVSQGQSVSKGQHIAPSGNTGFSTGPHLHFALIAGGGISCAFGGAKCYNPADYI